MDVEFLNSYTEVVLENFDSVLKQNLVFQTQLKILGKTKNQIEDLNKKLEEKDKLITELQNSIQLLQQDEYKNNSIINEKNRIQQALNDIMQQNVVLQENIKQKDDIILNCNQEISNLKFNIEELKPVPKLKKNNDNQIKNVINKNILNKEIIKSGGTF